MLLKGREGNELGLTPIAYQFPQSSTDPWDSNQLLVAVRVATPGGTWEVTDPCLTTWEARGLATWLLRATGIGTALGPSSFTQPNVSLRAARAAGPPGWFEVSAELELEERPPWAGLTGGGALHVALALEERQLLAAARTLLDELKDLPQRGPNPTL